MRSEREGGRERKKKAGNRDAVHVCESLCVSDRMKSCGMGDGMRGGFRAWEKDACSRPHSDVRHSEFSSDGPHRARLSVWTSNTSRTATFGADRSSDPDSAHPTCSRTPGAAAWLVDRPPWQWCSQPNTLRLQSASFRLQNSLKPSRSHLVGPKAHF